MQYEVLAPSSAERLLLGKVKWKPAFLRKKSKQEILAAVKEYTSPDVQAYAAAVYLLGCRRTEACFLRPGDFQEEEFLGRQWVVVRVANEKNRRVPEKNLPLLWGVDSFEDELMELLLSHLENFGEDEEVFGAASPTAWNHRLEDVFVETEYREPNWREGVRLKIPLFPHYLRHCRLSYLAPIGSLMLGRWAGWSAGNELLDIYISTDWRSLAKARVDAGV